MPFDHVAFVDDFRCHADGEHPDGWQIERHSHYPHEHGYAMSGAYGILVPGNKHIPLTPPLADATVEVVCRADALCSRTAGLVVFFRYQVDGQEGYAIRCQWKADGVTAAFGTARGVQFIQEEEQKAGVAIADVSVPVRLKLVIRGTSFQLFFQGLPLAQFQDSAGRFAQGRIAFDRVHFPGPCLLSEVRILASEPIPSEPLWPPFTAEIPVDLHGMDEPFRYRFEGWREPGRIRLVVRLSGGLPDKPEGTSGWFKETEELRRPYVGFRGRDGQGEARWHLVNGSVGFLKSPDGRNFLFVPTDAQTPVEATLYLPQWSEDQSLVIGYEHYCHSSTLHLQGGPAEALVSVPSGAILHAGVPLAPGALTLEVRSPADKIICGRIPAGHPLFDKAAAFARNNHFFMENEPIRFEAIVRFRDPTIGQDELTVRVGMENVFGEPMPYSALLPLAASPDALSATLADRLDARSWTAQIVPTDAVPVGVYHLRVDVMQAGRVVAQRRLAFEVMSEDPAAAAPPVVSGLPALYCMPHETKGLRTSVFCPWNGAGVDAAHYLSGQVYPVPFYRQTRAWEILRLYRRRSVAGTTYGTNDQAFEANTDVLAHVDLAELWACGEPGRYRYYLTTPGEYSGTLLDALKAFMQGPTFEAKPGSSLSYEAIKDLTTLPLAMILELLDKHWTPWADFANDWSAKVVAKWTAALKQTNPRAGRISYGPIPSFVSPYKTDFFTRQVCLDFATGWTQHFEFMFLEDYPDCCGYPFQRGPFQLAAMKLAAPGLKQYPEFYGLGSCPTDGSVLYGSPPYGYSNPTPGAYRKRIFEFVCATVWFCGGAYEYWRDDGFHASGWRAEHFAEFLRTWAQIRSHRPVKPLRTAAFATSREACRAHVEYVEKNVTDQHRIDLVNTAEECVAFAYEQARVDGQLAGFVTRLQDVHALDSADVHTLVLPPLCAVPDDQKQAIRRLHERGVNLVAFEDVAGLEDLFGVSLRRTAAAVRRVRLNPAWRDRPNWSALASVEERTAHPLCTAAYEAAGAEAILDGFEEHGAAVPALLTHSTQWGRTALFATPPTIIRRADPQSHEFGRLSISELINRSMALILRELGNSAVSATAGKLIAYRDAAGNTTVIVAEDAHPGMGVPIAPLVTLRAAGLDASRLTCDRPFAVVASDAQHVVLRLWLAPQDSAFIVVPAKDAVAERKRK